MRAKGGGFGGSGGKSKTGGGTIKIVKSKSRETKAIDDKLLVLRSALFNINGTDKDVTQSIGAAFMKYQRNGLDLTIHFQTSLSYNEMEKAFEMCKKNMEERYDASGYGWDDTDKRNEMNEKGKRYLIVRNHQGDFLGFVHFRFTVTGEVIDIMAGETCLLISDIHLENSIQRRGIGKHLITILELIARKEQMSRISISVQDHDDVTLNWLTKVKGYSPDVTMGLIGFDASTEGFDVYSKTFQVIIAPKPLQQSEPSLDNIVKSLASISVKTNNENINNDSNILDKQDSSKIQDDHTEDEETGCIDEKDLIEQLKSLFYEKNGREANEEEIKQWMETINESNSDITHESNEE